MSNIIITDSNKFEKIIEELENTIPAIQNSFLAQDRNFNIINDPNNYKGDCQRVLNEKYTKMRKNYESIQDSLTNYVKFLKIIVNNYREYEKSINEIINDNLDNLDVN